VNPRDRETRPLSEQYHDRIDDVLMSTMNPPEEKTEDEEEED
jgi:hypothetical protein